VSSGLYLAFAIPIYYRWKAGDSFKQGSWNLGNKWKWMAPLAVIEILITSVYFILPLYPAGAPAFMRGFLGAPSAEEVPFDWKFVNYAPIVLGVIFILLWIGWHVSAKKWFTGPKMTVDLPGGRVVGRRDRPRARAQGIPPAARNLRGLAVNRRGGRTRRPPLLLSASVLSSPSVVRCGCAPRWGRRWLPAGRGPGRLAR
jgi:hypothetical protein